jgi:hypothetical protein
MSRQRVKVPPHAKYEKFPHNPFDAIIVYMLQYTLRKGEIDE